MKTMKRMGCLLLVLAMCLALGVTAMAASEYSITIENSIGGVNYSVYKVFDVTYATDGDGNVTGVSYTITEDDLWYKLVSADGSPFTLTPSPDESYYVVSTTASATKIAAWFSAIEEYPEGSQVGSSKEGNGGSLTFDLNEAGYYLIVPASNSYDPVAVTVDTAAPNVTVIDKNQGPGENPGPTPPPDDPVPGPTPSGQLSKDTVDDSYSVGDTIEYSISSYSPTYDGKNKVVDYTFTDTMGTGLTLDESSVSVYIYGTGIVNTDGNASYIDITKLCDIEVDIDSSTSETVLTVNFEIANIEGYPADAVVVIVYSATVNESADETNLYNGVTQDWEVEGPNDEPVPGPEDPPTTDKTIYTYGFDLKKTDSNGSVLSGAQFTLANGDDLITFLYDSTSDTYEVWDGESEGTIAATITVADGEVNIWGLAAGTYTLTEIVAPDGYNLLSEAVEIVIEATVDDVSGEQTGWSVTVDGGNPAYGVIASTSEHGVSSMPTISIVNSAGSELPGTGGIGTTIFYVIGAILVCGAVVLLVTKRRVDGKAEG